MNGLLISRNADDKVLSSCVLYGMDDPVVAAHQFMDYLRDKTKTLPYCCEVWVYKSREVLKLLVTVF